MNAEEKGNFFLGTLAILLVLVCVIIEGIIDRHMSIGLIIVLFMTMAGIFMYLGFLLRHGNPKIKFPHGCTSFKTISQIIEKDNILMVLRNLDSLDQKLVFYNIPIYMIVSPSCSQKTIFKGFPQYFDAETFKDIVPGTETSRHPELRERYRFVEIKPRPEDR